MAVILAAVFSLVIGLTGAATAAPAQAEDKLTAQARKDLTDAKTSDFWVRFSAKADLSRAPSISDWAERGRFVHDELTSTAEKSQAGVRADLEKSGVQFEAHWITNAILVKDGTLDLAEDLAEDPAVSQIRETTVLPQEDPVDRKPAGNQAQAVEWGVAAINADDVWADGITGSGITVANIDSGVDGDHPALETQYRGHVAGGSPQHDYNWFDVAGACGGEVCDTDGHGSHTMGTMVGDDGAGNQIGVAPGADWIAANGCSTCADQDLIDSGEWILAPTRADGTDPDPAMRPHVVNNSWGSRNPSTSPFMEDVILAWEAAGIFGSWANGNSGELGCESSGSPGSRIATYSAGAYDSSGNIAYFSGRGPGQDGEVKPNIAAPGVNVRSAVVDGYDSISGTSMAAPHLGGAVALLWSAAPALVGDIEGTRALLDQTAVDTEDLTCGGTADDNNVWGEGKLDAAALIDAAPVGDTGTLAGTVTDDATDAPIAGAEVAVDGPMERTVTTDENGEFSLAATTGDYTLTASAFGYGQATANATVTAGETTTVPLPLTPVESYALTGTVTFDGDAVAGAEVSLDNVPVEPVTTGDDGRFSFASVPEGSYTLRATVTGCAAPFASKVVVSDGDTDVDVAMDPLQDEYGYFCTPGTGGYQQGDTLLDLHGDDAGTSVEMPFAFPFYGESYDTAYVSTNGNLNFLEVVTSYSNDDLPDSSTPNAAIYPFWDDLRMDDGSEIYTATTTVDGVDAFVVEWRDIHIYGDSDARTNFSATLLSDGRVVLGYGEHTADKPRTSGSSATVGIENADGSIASEYSYNTAGSITPGTSITYDLPDNGTLSGVVTDYNDELPVSGATVTVNQDGEDPVTYRTGEDGSYNILLFVGDYTIDVSAPNYQSESTDVSITEDGQAEEYSPALKTGIAEVDAPSFDYLLREGESSSDEFTVTNSGSAPLEVNLAEGVRNAEQSSVPAQQLAPAREKASAEKPHAKTAAHLYTPEQRKMLPTVSTDADGDILAEWETGIGIPWGVGFDGNVWISDPEQITNTEFTTSGGEVASYPAGWGGTWPGDLATNSRTGEMCQVSVGGDNAIHCFDPATGEESSVISGSEWTATSQRGLAYNAADDVFYIGGWNDEILFTVAGPTHSTPGATLDQCVPAEPNIAGLAYNPTSGSVWMVPSASSTVLYQLSPADCGTVKTVAFPSEGETFTGGGLEMDRTSGALWATNQKTGKAYLIDVGDPHTDDVEWLSAAPQTATIAPGESATFTVNVDATGLEPAAYGANVIVNANAGRTTSVEVPVDLVVSKYMVGVNAGGDAYTDTDEFGYYADQAWSDGGWGYTGNSKTDSTSSAIDGTSDDELFQSSRTREFSYQFDDAPAGTYQVDLGFAEYKKKPGKRIFDVKVNGEFALVEHDVAAEAGKLAADEHTLVIEHDGGDLTIEFAGRRSYGDPIVSAIKVAERADLE